MKLVFDYLHPKSDLLGGIRDVSPTTEKRELHSASFAQSSSLAALGILLLWICLYSISDDSTHLGSFFGNAIADWSGVLVTILATKYMYEKGSAESRQPLVGGTPRSVWTRVRNHSLTIFFLITGTAWVVAYMKMDSEGKWGQVVGNIVSEWTQIIGLVLLTKKLIEPHSKESKQ